nr:retrovirus-related Pol polyprotein from transposon TNT 1-94 [Tanacetum cinerariifolium]
MQQFSTARPPQQNGRVKRSNSTLVEAARTMLIFSRLAKFLWAKEISTACFTQNCLIIHTWYNKALYDILHGRKPNVEYFHVFRSLCYPQMIEMTLVKSTNTLSKQDLDNLFWPMYKEYIEKRSSDMSINSVAQQVHNHKDLPMTSSIINEEHEAPPIVTTYDEQTYLISINVADEFNQEDFARFDGNTLLTPYDAPNNNEAESSTTALDPSNMHEFHQSQYVIELLKKHGIDDCVSMSTLMATERLDANLQSTPTDQMTYRHVDHEGCKDDCKSTSGGLQFLGEKLMSWSSKKQDCTAMSTTEAGYVSLFACCA